MVRQLGMLECQNNKQTIFKTNDIIGKPDIFATLSASEKTWEELAHQIFSTIPEKERISMYKGNTLDELTSAMREKMIADNFILMSHHFHSRIGKLIKYMQSQNHCFGGFRVCDYFYR